MHNLKELCRICLNNSGAISIFDKGAEITIIEAIFSITNIQILYNDMFPNSICICCLESINSALKLCENVKFAEDKLKQIVTDIEKISDTVIDKGEVEEPCSVPIRQSINKHSAGRVEQIQTESAQSIDSVIDIVTDDEDESSASTLVENVQVTDKKLTQSNASAEPVIFEIETDEEEDEQSTLRTLLLKGINPMEEQWKQMPDAGEESIIIEDDTDEDEGEKSALELRKYIEQSEKNSSPIQITGQRTPMGTDENDKSYLKDAEYTSESSEHDSSVIKSNSGRQRKKRETNKKIKKSTEVINNDAESHTLEQFANSSNPMVNGNEFVCQICDKPFLDISSHRWHMILSHESPLTVPHFKCERCSKVFTHGYLLKRHKDMHCGRIHNCNICGKGFFRSYSMKEHIRTVHLKEKRFVCTVCSKAFGTSANLRSHFRCLHINDKPFQCKHCQSKFFRLRYLQNHIIRNHSIESIVEN